MNSEGLRFSPPQVGAADQRAAALLGGPQDRGKALEPRGQDRRRARPRVQAQHRRHALRALARGRDRPARARRQGPRVRPRLDGTRQGSSRIQGRALRQGRV